MAMDIKKSNMASHIDEHLTINVMLFDHLDRKKRERVTLGDLKEFVKE